MKKSDFEKNFQEFEKQRRLFEYQNSRILVRPKTKIFDVLAIALAYFLIIGFCVFLNIKISVPYYYEIPFSVIVYVFISEIVLRYLGIKIVECYQHYAKEITRRQCICIPSCSEYAIICFKKYLLIKALLKIQKRLLVTCKGHLFKIDPP